MKRICLIICLFYLHVNLTLGQDIQAHKFISSIYPLMTYGTEKPFRLEIRAVPTKFDIIKIKEITHSLKSSLPKEDLLQLLNTKNDTINWDQNLLPNFTIIDNRKLKKGIRTGGDIKGNLIHTFSSPAFNLKKDYCLIYGSYYCGFTCGGGCLYLFQLKKGKWIIKELIECYNI